MTAAIERTSSDKDPFATFTDFQKKWYNFDNGQLINETIHSINNVPITLLVDIKLVGFNGDGNEGIQVTEHDLGRYLHALPPDLPSVVLQPLSELALKPHLAFAVERLDTGFHNRIEQAIQNSVHRARAGVQVHNAPRIPYKVVDSLIGEHYKPSNAALTLYILNPKAIDAESYLYQYDDDERHNQELSNSCPGTLYVGTRPYVWIDLTATVRYYGPGTGHKGQVYVHSFPRVSEYKQSINSHAILPDMAALIWSSCQHLLWPPVMHSHMKPAKKLDIHVIHMHDTLVAPTHRTLGLDLMQDQLQRSPAAQATEISISQSSISFARCNLCVAAYNNALRLRNGRALSTLIQGKVAHFLDSRSLHSMLKEYADAIMADAGVYDSEDRTILPVFLFDMFTDEPMVIDYNLQSVAFEDMIIAVRTRATEADSHFVCDYRHVFLDGINLTRPVLASILQSAWGVADTHLYYTNATGENVHYLWSVGNSLFGPLSSSIHISGVEQASMLRNLVLTEIQKAVNRTTRVLRGLARLADNNKPQDALPRSHLPMYRQRINVLQIKLHEAALKLQHGSGKMALHYAQSAMRDVEALEQMVHSLHSKLQPRLKCRGTLHATWQLWLAPAGAVLLLLGACAYRYATAEKKTKQY